MESGYDIHKLKKEAQIRWLKPDEVLYILENYKEHQLSTEIPYKPSSGSVYLFSKQEHKYFRKDGHSWRKRKDQKTCAEAHERLKVKNVDTLSCYYAHGEENPRFQRRSYWMLDREHKHIVLVHYRETEEGRQNPRSKSQASRPSSYTFSNSPNYFTTHKAHSASLPLEFNNQLCDQSSLCSEKISSTEAIMIQRKNHLIFKDRVDEVNNSSLPELNQVLQLSLNDGETNESNRFYVESEESIDVEDFLINNVLYDSTSSYADYLPQQYSDDSIQQHPLPGVELMLETSKSLPDVQSGVQLDRHDAVVEVDIWKDVLDNSKSSADVEFGVEFGRHDAKKSSTALPFEEPVEYLVHSSILSSPGIHSDFFSTTCEQTEFGISVENGINLVNSCRQKFTIKEISPAWCYCSEGAKIIIVGSFLCNPSEFTWACMFGDTEVPIQIIHAGVICCYAPPHVQGKVPLSITSGNGQPSSEIKEFEYRAEPSVCAHNIPPQKEDCESPKELLLLVRFVQMLLSDASHKECYSIKPESSSGVWSQVIDALLIGTSTPFRILYWILQEVLKDKLGVWLSSRSCDCNENGCSLSKKEQGIIHMASGMGFEWAIQPILGTGVSVNFRDFNGHTALHWAAQYGREKMVVALIASGASAGAISDPTSKDPSGKTAASVAAMYGHQGLARYLSEVALTSQLSSLVIEEIESAELKAEEIVNKSISTPSPAEAQDTLAAVRCVFQAAARINSENLTNTFGKKQQKEAALTSTRNKAYDCSILEKDIQGLSAASKRAFGHPRDWTAALSIQKNYRGYEVRKHFISLRHNAVKIQAHMRGYLVRKKYTVRWAVGILEKVILRWRRHGVGFRGYHLDLDCKDEDILRVFRKQKLKAAIDEAVLTVLSTVKCPAARQQYGRILATYRQATATFGFPPLLKLWCFGYIFVVFLGIFIIQNVIICGSIVKMRFPMHHFSKK